MAGRIKNVGITFTGDAELERLLRAIPKNLVTEAKAGMRAVGMLIVRAARSKLRKGHGLLTGQLKKSLGVRDIRTYHDGTQEKVVMYVGPRKGFAIEVQGRTGKRSHDPAMIAHLVEYGHKGGGFMAGKDVEAKPFLRPAVDENRSRFLQVMKDKLRKIVARRGVSL